jgi:hypothetical protein
MGNVDDVQLAEGNRQPECDRRIESAKQNTGDYRVQKQIYKHGSRQLLQR